MASSRGVVPLLLLPLFLLLLLPGTSLGAAFVEVPATFGGATVSLGGLSGDGQVLVGRTLSPGPFAGIRWTQATGWQVLGAPPGNAYARPAAASFDGSAVAGTGDVSSAHRWVQGVGWQTLFAGEASAISADGSVVAGTYLTLIFPAALVPLYTTVLSVWQEGIGTTSQVVADSPWSFTATGITGDGGAVIGNRVSILGHAIPMRFTVGGGSVELPVVPEGTSDECVTSVDVICAAYAWAVSADGNTLVGGLDLDLADPPRAVRWQGNGAPVFLDGGPSSPWSVAHDVSGGGRMIVGERDGAAFLWTAGGGMQDVKTLLEGLGIDLTGWTLANASFISDDGSVIAGTGTRPGGAYAIWIAQAPELVPVAQVPAVGVWGGVVLAMALVCAAAARIRSRQAGSSAPEIRALRRARARRSH